MARSKKAKETLSQKDKVVLQKEVEKGNSLAQDVLDANAQNEDYNTKIEESGKISINENSPDQIYERMQMDMLQNDINSTMDETFSDEITNNFGNEVKEKVEKVVEAGKEYKKTVEEKQKEVEEKPERSLEAGEIVDGNAEKINQGHKDLRESETKEEFAENADRLVNLYEYGKVLLNKHTREANKKDKIFAEAIEGQEEIINKLQANIDKKYPEQKKEYENEKRAIEEEKLLLKALITSAKSEEEKLEYEKSIKQCDKYIEEIYPQIIKDIDNNIKKDTEQIESIAKQIAVFKEARDNIRKDKYRPAAVIAAGYNKLVEVTPTMIKEAKDVKNVLTEILHQAEKKATEKMKTIGKWMGNKFLDSIKKVTKKINTWVDAKEAELNPQYQGFIDNLNKMSADKQKIIQEKFEKPWYSKYSLPLGVWDKNKTASAINYFKNIGQHKEYTR